MAKLYRTKNQRPGDPDFSFYCPGCECDHGVWTTNNSGPVWTYNNDIDKPTFRPSLLVTAPYAGVNHICHTFITDGKIEYLNDCTHSFAGKTVEMEDVN